MKRAHLVPLADLQRAAYVELRSNPTITVWEQVDGEIHRRPAAPLAVLNYAIEQCLDMLCTIIGVDPNIFRDFTASLRAKGIS